MSASRSSSARPAAAPGRWSIGAGRQRAGRDAGHVGGSTIVIKRTVAAGIGLAFVSRLACELELRSGTLVQIKTPDLKISRPLYSLHVRDRHEGPAVAEFDRLLDEAVRRFRAVRVKGADPPPAFGTDV